jgi:diaminopimelate decarboxylase
VVVDAAMNDLIRPALYHAHHEIVPLRKNGLPPVTADVVGPVCESGDFLARGRLMADAMPGDYLAVCDAGAYGFVLSSNYNSRPRVPEVLVDGASFRVIRERETYIRRAKPVFCSVPSSDPTRRTTNSGAAKSTRWSCTTIR